MTMCWGCDRDCGRGSVPIDAYTYNLCDDCVEKGLKMKESLAETRARFRKEFEWCAIRLAFDINYAKAWSEPQNDEGESRVARFAWAAFAVGAGHPHNAKFRDD